MTDGGLETRPVRSRVWLWVAIVVVGACIVRSPTLWTGLHMDDLAQRAMVDGAYPAVRPWWDLYRFSGLSPKGNLTLMNAGSLPWWSSPDLRLGVFRPLASGLVWLDVQMGNPVIAHLHSLAWWGAMLLAAYRVVARMLGQRWGLISTALFALDGCHIFPLGWLANRTAIISVLFGLLALDAYIRWRRDDWRAGRWLSPGLTAAAVLAGEYAFSVLGFFVAFVLLGDRGSNRDRLRAALPTVAIAVGLLGLARGLGYGAAGSEVYLDPLSDPGGYAMAAMHRFPLLISDLLSGVAAQQLQLAPVHPAISMVVLVAGLVGLLVLARAVFRSGEARAVATWLLGSVLALLPVLASFSSTRLTIAAALGVHVALGGVLLATGRALWGKAWSARGVALGLGSVVVVAAHVGWAAHAGHEETKALRRFNEAGMTVAATLPHGGPEQASEHWVLLSSQDPMTMTYPAIASWLQGNTMPRSWWTLALSRNAYEVTRTSPRALEFLVKRDPLLTSPIERFFRHRQDPLRVGDSVELAGMKIDILAANEDGGVTRLRFTFEHRLEHRSLRFFVLGDRGFVEYPIGPVGATMTILSGMSPVDAADSLGT